MLFRSQKVGERERTFAQAVQVLKVEIDELDVVRKARFSGAFTFEYSPRPGTPAATMEEQVPAAVVSERYMRLVELQNEIAWEENKRKLGEVVEVIVREAEGKKDDRTDRQSGRARDNRLVHVAHTNARPGDVVTARVTYPDGRTVDMPLIARIDTVDEIGYFKSGGILQHVLRNLAA